MNAPHDFTPETGVARALQPEWMKLFTMLLFKVAGRQKLTIRGADIDACRNAFGGMPVLFANNLHDALEFQVVDKAEAERLAELARATPEGRS